MSNPVFLHEMKKRTWVILMSLIFIITVCAFLISSFRHTVSFDDDSSITLEKIEWGNESLPPEQLMTYTARLLHENKLTTKMVSKLRKGPPPFTKVAKAQSAPHHIPGMYKCLVNIPDFPYSQNQGSMFIWFSLKNPESIVPLHGVPWDEMISTGGSALPNERNVVLIDEHGCQVSASINRASHLEYENSYFLCAIFHSYNQTSSKGTVVVDYAEGKKASFKVHIPSLSLKPPLPSVGNAGSLPQKVSTPFADIWLNAWRFPKNSLSPYDTEHRGTWELPKECYDIKVVKEGQDITNGVVFSRLAIGDVMGGVDRPVCAYSPEWIFHGEVFLNDIGRLDETHKVVFNQVPSLKAGAAYKISLADDSVFKDAFFVGPGCYFFDDSGLRHASTLEKEPQALEAFSSFLNPDKWKWEYDLQESASPKGISTFIFKAENYRFVFRLKPSPSTYNILQPSDFGIYAEPRPNRWETLYFSEEFVRSTNEIRIGVSEKYPFAIRFKTTEAIQEDAKAALIQK